MKRTLRPDQAAVIPKIKLSLARGNMRPLVQAPTGYGKTVLSAAIVEMVRAKRNRVIFVVPAISLINQTVESFYFEGITEIGVMQGNHELTNPAMPVQVASVQTLQNRKIPHADLVIVDEAHRCLLYTSPSPRDLSTSRMPSSA